MTDNSVKPVRRLEGLDIARWFAFVGMVIVNFNIVLVATANNQGIYQTFVEALQGRAAATFVVLAGIGLGLSVRNSGKLPSFTTIVIRSLFLFVIGMLNQIIFEADIIHFYAVYFLLGFVFLGQSSKVLWWGIAALVCGFVGMSLLFDYSTGWNWSTYAYDDFWTLEGFLRNLFFNGWHPVFPWLSFLLFGMWLSRLELGSRKTQWNLVLIGGLVFVSVTALSYWLTGILKPLEEEAELLVTTSPVPPMPLFVLAGFGISSFVVGLCLLFENVFRQVRLLDFIVPAGKMTLTLYFAHIIIGMGILEALGYLDSQTPGRAIVFALAFCMAATVVALLWNIKFRYGPLEAIQRRLSR